MASHGPLGHVRSDDAHGALPVLPQRPHERGRPRRTRRRTRTVVTCDHRELGAESLRLASHLTGEFHPRGVHVHVVGDEDAAFAQRVPGGPKLEAHALIGVLAVVHEEVDRADAVEQRRELVLRPTEHQLPTIAKRRRHHPARLLPRRDHRAALAVPERPSSYSSPATSGRSIECSALAVVLQGEQQEGGRDPLHTPVSTATRGCSSAGAGRAGAPRRSRPDP